MSPGRHDLIVRRDRNQITPAAEWLVALARPALRPDDVMELELAFVEALTNAIVHGAAEEDEQIQIHATTQPGEVSVELVDCAPPIPRQLLDAAGRYSFEFDDNDIATLPESGRGLALMVALSDEVSYRTEKGQTLLRLVRRNRAG